jgi:hypothetical protein
LKCSFEERWLHKINSLGKTGVAQEMKIGAFIPQCYEFDMLVVTVTESLVAESQLTEIPNVVNQSPDLVICIPF